MKAFLTQLLVQKDLGRVTDTLYKYTTREIRSLTWSGCELHDALTPRCFACRLHVGTAVSGVVSRRSLCNSRRRAFSHGSSRHGQSSGSALEYQLPFRYNS